jgi:hypothetical protein
MHMLQRPHARYVQLPGHGGQGVKRDGIVEMNFLSRFSAIHGCRNQPFGTKVIWRVHNA